MQLTVHVTDQPLCVLLAKLPSHLCMVLHQRLHTCQDVGDGGLQLLSNGLQIAQIILIHDTFLLSLPRTLPSFGAEYVRFRYACSGLLYCMR